MSLGIPESMASEYFYDIKQPLIGVMVSEATTCQTRTAAWSGGQANRGIVVKRHNSICLYVSMSVLTLARSQNVSSNLIGQGPHYHLVDGHWVWV